MEGNEILPPALSKKEAIPLIDEAVKHFTQAKRATIQVMADLRRLQDGQVHLAYGYKNFGKWAEATFDGLAAGNVRQLCRAGAVVLELQRRELVDLDLPTGIGTTALRELATVSGMYGDDKMVEVFLTAKDMLTGQAREVSGTTIQAAMLQLMPPADKEFIEDETDRYEMEKLIEDEGDQTERGTITQELMDRVRDLSWDLPESMYEVREALEQLEAHVKAESNDDDQTWIEGTR